MAGAALAAHASPAPSAVVVLAAAGTLRAAAEFTLAAAGCRPSKQIGHATMRNALRRAGSAVANFFRRGRGGAPAARNAGRGSSY
jgi:hypothetical protein